jgi:hypothetical protein
MKLAGHQGRGMEAQGRILAPGEGYQENDLTKVIPMDPEAAAAFVHRIRMRQRALMEERARQIEAGLRHLTPAAERDVWREAQHDDRGAAGGSTAEAS